MYTPNHQKEVSTINQITLTRKPYPYKSLKQNKVINSFWITKFNNTNH